VHERECNFADTPREKHLPGIDALHSHLYQQHGQKCVKCEICGKEWVQERSLKRHKCKNNGTTAAQRPVKTLKLPQSLIQNVQVHTVWREVHQQNASVQTETQGLSASASWDTVIDYRYSVHCVKGTCKVQWHYIAISTMQKHGKKSLKLGCGYFFGNEFVHEKTTNANTMPQLHLNDPSTQEAEAASLATRSQHYKVCRRIW